MPAKSTTSHYDLSLDYSTEMTETCLKIQKNHDDVYKYTIKGNLVAIITNGTAVHGLGNLGALASKPAMESKAMLLKKYAGIDAFDIELNTTDIDVFIRTVITMSPTFGAINLEAIKAPDCFEIEQRLIDALDIPLMHDDQHGTAVVSAAGLLNACEIAGKSIQDIKVVVSGTGAAAIACAEMYLSLGLKKENLIMLDSKGIISQNRIDLDKYEKPFAINTHLSTLEQGLPGADAFVELSMEFTITPKMVESMADHPIIFALADPNPELTYTDAIKAKYGIIMATGKADLPNQISSLLGFPYIFRAALDVRATKINTEMKKAAVYALASLAKEVSKDAVAFHRPVFGRDYFIPKPSDPRLISAVTPAVAKAAIESGVAGVVINDWKSYLIELDKHTII
ncbi:MAG: malic enzyme-like NAD(P)-binding protein [Cyclobacteriaceae bacterium]|nr:malic enzyme-like NAD(P)-binding protein [Cyclobacteriaceae bacterium]